MTESRQLALLRAHNLQPKRSLSQNFLVDEVWLKRIADAANLNQNSLVLEIGAGLGGLTRYLAAVTRQVIALEIDQRLIAILESEFAGQANVCVVHGDATILDPSSLPWAGDIAYAGFVAVGNLPYHVANRIIRNLFFGSELRPDRIVALVQSDVADRICAEPGDMSLLAVSCQLNAETKRLLQLPAGAFLPRPQIRSTLLEFTTRSACRSRAAMEEVMAVAKAGFGQRRKQLANTLASTFAISKTKLEETLLQVGVDPTRRPETLSIAEWTQVTSAVAATRCTRQEGST